MPSDKIVKFKSLTGEINKLDCRGEIGHSNEIVENNTMKLIWGYLTATMNIGRSGEIVFDEIVVKFKFNAMKLIVNKSVVLSWVYLQPFLTDTGFSNMYTNTITITEMVRLRLCRPSTVTSTNSKTTSNANVFRGPWPFCPTMVVSNDKMQLADTNIDDIKKDKNVFVNDFVNDIANDFVNSGGGGAP